MAVSIIRTFILFGLVMIVLRIMGKRQIGELQPFELAITIMVSALAAVPMEDTDIPLTNTIIPILTLLILEVFISSFTLKSRKGRVLISSKPAILIENGKIIEDELNKNRMNINDLLEQLRIKGFPSLSEVEFAVLESNGEMSVIPKSQKRPVTPEDLDISTDYEGIPYPIIIDGVILDQNLKKIDLSASWLEQEMDNLGIKDPSGIFFAEIDSQGNIFYQKKGESQHCLN